MVNTQLNGSKLKDMMLVGAKHLANHVELIDALNVFPVPDGDTGTNMNLSTTSGANEVRGVKETSVSAVAKAFAKGLLMGARGNSGVILSQLFRGFSKSVEDLEVLTTKTFAKALDQGVKTAYQAVIKPVEGTILTVARETAESAVILADETDDFDTFFNGMLSSSKQSLKRTPDLLPVLKEVGVVDSGGKGLVVIYEGFVSAFKGEALPDALTESLQLDALVKAEHNQTHQKDYLDTADIEFGYCTEFMVKFEDALLKTNPYDEESFREELSQLGDSLLVVSDESYVRVHVHVEYPGEALNIAQRYGSFTMIKIENMREQHREIVEKEVETRSEKATYAIISIAAGTGVVQLFKELGSTVVIEGGQTMNPSTQDITEAIEKANAKQIIILPNNKNIIMAARQAAELATDDVTVVPTTSIPQGMAALLQFSDSKDLETNTKDMTEQMYEVKTGQITYAIRDTKIDGLTIETDQFMGILNGKIKVADFDEFETIKQLLDGLLTDDEEIVTIIQGQEGTKALTEKAVAYIEEIYPDIEVEVHEGQQPVYSYIFSAE